VAQQQQQLQPQQQTLPPKPTVVVPEAKITFQQLPTAPLSLDNLCTPEISDMEEDLMSYEMEMNRIDFHNDLSTILDQIEKDFESPGIIGGLMVDDVQAALDTPPDSDSENYCQNPNSSSSANSFATSDLLSHLLTEPFTAVKPNASSSHSLPVMFADISCQNIKQQEPQQQDLLGFDRFVRVATVTPPRSIGSIAPAAAAVFASDTRLSLDQLVDETIQQQQAQQQKGCTLVQSPDSLAKVGPLNPKAMALLSQLPSKLFSCFGGDATSRLVNVVKVENGVRTPGSSNTNVAQHPAAAALCGANITPYTVINIECHQPGKNGEMQRKVLETYRAIETNGGEIRLVAAGSAIESSPRTPSFFGNSVGGVGSVSSPMSTCSSMDNLDVNSPSSLSSAAEDSSPAIIDKRSFSNCNVCGKNITAKNMARHMEKHSTVKNKAQQQQTPVLLSCGSCIKKFLNKSDLLEHLRSAHATNTIFCCDRCKQTFTDQSGLFSHRRSHPECNLGPIAEQHRQAPKPYSCRSCKRSFSQKGHLNRHEKTHNGGHSEDLTCKVCGKRCKNQVGLVRHRARHLACLQCAVVFDSKVALQEHLLKKHPESAVITVEKSVMVEEEEEEEEEETKTDSAAPDLSTSGTTSRGDSFLVSCCADYDEEEDKAVGLCSDFVGTTTVIKGLSPDAVGESLIDISDSNFFDFTKDLNDEFYSTDLF
jgi:hypothetical protein